MSMKKHDVEFLLGYGVRLYKERTSSSTDGHPNEGKWYHRLNEGFVCGDQYTVIRFYSLDNYKVLEEKK